MKRKRNFNSDIDSITLYLTDDYVEVLKLINKKIEVFKWSFKFFQKNYKSIIKRYKTSYCRLIIQAGFTVNVSTKYFKVNEVHELFKQKHYIKTIDQVKDSILYNVTDTNKKQSIYGMVDVYSKEVGKLIKFIQKHFNVISKETYTRHLMNISSKIRNNFKTDCIFITEYYGSKVLLYFNTFDKNYIDDFNIIDVIAFNTFNDILLTLEKYNNPRVINLYDPIQNDLLSHNISMIDITVGGVKIADTMKSILLQHSYSQELIIPVNTIPEDMFDEEPLHKSFIPKRIQRFRSLVFNCVTMIICMFAFTIGVYVGESLIGNDFWTLSNPTSAISVIEHK